jgi:hypothetical protein
MTGFNTLDNKVKQFSKSGFAIIAGESKACSLKVTGNKCARTKYSESRLRSLDWASHLDEVCSQLGAVFYGEYLL